MDTMIKLLSNTITLSSTNTATKKSNWGSAKSQHHTITVETEENTITFDFWASVAQPYVRTAQDLLEAFSAFLSDAMAGDMEYEEFCIEFGYELHSKKSKDVYSSCLDAYDDFLSLEILEDVYDIINELNEKYEI